ncbi:hypothetical protein D9758_000907 [Tetrapyrgos nigripes]|uniref:Mitochondrial distribution and morphology protein 12 n=1 Tax=Tetrapyrgos nigripes TaxID=182062 RepID=A0A8H5LY07_9AGAR|nr:hypothetical protein D9758_000907 [Tetrapyrgos nigripes]
MSIDLEWNSLDSSLSDKLVDILNRQLSQTSRPSFIGPVEVISLNFGSTSPDVELVDLRDIYRDFLEDDEDNSDQEPAKVTENAEEDDDGFEWVSRRAAKREEGLAFQQYPHLRYGRGGPMDMFASTPSLNTHLEPYNPTHSLVDYRPLHMSWPNMPMYASSMSQIPMSAPANRRSFETGGDPASPLHNSNDDIGQGSAPQNAHSEQQPPDPPPNNHPNLQLHFHVNWNSDLRITLTTSLLINYPSPMFMSLPIKLSVTGLIFTGEIAVAYEGERGRVHLCILDDLDPYGPAADRPKRDASHTPPELDLDDESPTMTRHSKPLPIGKRLLPSIFIESEIGQTDKHVLKNVTRVERFIQDVIRKTIEEELIFPNFHTLVMGG